MLELSGVSAGYPGAGGTTVPVVRGVNLRVAPGEIFGLVGESGCGKTTVARLAAGLLTPLAGTVRIGGVDLNRARGDDRRRLRRQVQMVFQDPGQSLSPRMTVAAAVAEPLRIHRVLPRSETRERVRHLLDLVGLHPDLAQRLPAQLSGGQRQRVAIARALALKPTLLICDEPVTALDVSVQAVVLNLLGELRDRLGLACLFIAHDLAVVRRLADRVAVMYAGRIVEQSPAAALSTHALHPYSRALLAAAPRVARRPQHHARLPRPHRPGQLPTVHLGSGCDYAPRCPDRAPGCVVAPALRPLELPPPGARGTHSCHCVACHVPLHVTSETAMTDLVQAPASAPAAPLPTATPWSDLLARWDRQQMMYIEHRERRFQVMFDFLAELRPGPAPVVLDLACGPGAISERLLKRYPQGRAVAVDADPVLLRIGQEACGDHQGRLRWVQADLRDPAWVTRLTSDSAPGSFDAVLSSTALHWLNPPELVAVYRAVATLLRPGGVLINGDYLPMNPASSRIKAAAAAVSARRQNDALGRGAEDWDAWWASVEAMPELAQEIAMRRQLWPEGTRGGWAAAGLDYHSVALREAGFAEVDLVWQDLEEGVLIAAMP